MSDHKLTFVGVGSAFSGRALGQSNMVLESKNEDGERCYLMIDSGQRSQDMLEDEFGIGNHNLGQVEGAYITHQHADHIGGLEWFGLCTFFNPNVDRPKLFCQPDLMKVLWDESLQGGLKTLQVGEATLTTFFDCVRTPVNKSFVWRGIRLSPVQTVHVVSGFGILPCYGLMIEREAPVVAMEKKLAEADAKVSGITDDFIGGIAAMDRLTKIPQERDWTRIFLTGDTQFAPNQLKDFYKHADVVLHDCETTEFRSNVHAHIEDLKGLSDEVKSKMWLYHYNSPKETEEAHADGFAGFVQKGQSFEF